MPIDYIYYLKIPKHNFYITFSIPSINEATSPSFGNLPEFFLLKIKLLFNSISKTPPLDGLNSD